MKSSEGIEDPTGGFVVNKARQSSVRTNSQTRRAHNNADCNEITQQQQSIQTEPLDNKSAVKSNQRKHSSRNAREMQMVWQKKQQAAQPQPQQQQQQQQQDQDEVTYLPITIETMSSKACTCNCSHARKITENHSPKTSQNPNATSRKYSAADMYHRPVSSLSLVNSYHLFFFFFFYVRK